MKKIILTFSLIFAYFINYSQGSIKIYTDLKEETAQFMVWINEEPQDAYPSDEVEIEDLLPGKFIIQVSFNADTIADWVKTIKLKKNEQVVYKVVKMKEIGKEAGKIGRNLNKETREAGDDLIQYYRLVKEREN
ncbi:MAG: hypothetical protein L3J35_00110 [Bacteroidales bacterium]|nr:hypothetical protein [Bacteroidales bacterium]